MDVDDPGGEGEDPNDGEDVDEGPARIRYINLEAHLAMAFHELGLEVDQRGDMATFVVRHESGLFMEHAMSRLSNPPDDSYRARFFVTGQPRIGKSFGCYYFLFRLLALGQSVFFLNGPTTVYYFSSDGVQETNETPRNGPRHSKLSETAGSSSTWTTKPTGRPPRSSNALVLRDIWRQEVVHEGVVKKP
ncbi:hypothetical protein C8F04DRAFT_241695 [Mycena alexandri]|uniref:Uncharacterized protein n=1 Tax=Mycena alexandri TaxID=1745969 RepID=A0AAD6S6Z0_9AGAR|nr:hypothetical protein C8F04DRAFT_241695 [Mycena alexandri]